MMRQQAAKPYLMAVIAAALAAALAACEQSPATPAATPEPAPAERTATCADSAIQLVGRSEAVHGAIVQDVLYMGGKTADATCTQDASRALLMLPADAYPEAQTQAASWYLLVVVYAADNIRLYVVRAQDGAECIVDTRNQCIARVTDLAAGFNVDDLPDDVPATVPGGRAAPPAPAPAPEPDAPPPPPTSVPAPAGDPGEPGPAGPADDAIDWEAVCPKWRRASIDRYEIFGSISYTLPDPGGEGEPTFTMEVSHAQQPEYWTVSPAPALNGRTLTFTVSSGGDPIKDDADGDGSISFYFSVSNAYSERDDSRCGYYSMSHSVDIHVGDPTAPEFRSKTGSKRTFTKGVSATIVVRHGLDYEYPRATITATGVPSGMSLTHGGSRYFMKGTMTGTPDTVGTGTVTVTATNASGTDTHSFEWEVKEPETTP